MSCLKHSSLDSLYKWRLNMCDQIFLLGCAALGMPLASVKACHLEATTQLRKQPHLQPSSSVLGSIVY